MTTPESTSTALALAAGRAIAHQSGELQAVALGAREKALVEARALVAINRPRDFDACRLRILGACRRPVFAALARYSKKIGGKPITGLSVRYAEEARRLFGNIAVMANVISDTASHVTYRVEAIDLETNASDSRDIIIAKTVERKFVPQGETPLSSRTNSNGETTYLIIASEDALVTKVAAQIAKARREVILSLIPADVKEESEDVIVETLQKQDAQDPEGTKRKILSLFFDLGVEPRQVALFLQQSEQAPFSPAQINLLRTIYTAIKEGETTWAEATDQTAKPSTAGEKPIEQQRGTAGLAARVAKKKEQQREREPGEETEEDIRRQDAELAAKEGQHGE